MRRRTRSRSPVRTGTASLTAPLAHLADGGNDVGVSGTSADVAAHPLGDLGMGQRRRGRDIRRHVAGPARVVFGQERDGGADLAGGTVAALEAIMAHKGGLHRIESAVVS